MHHLRPLLSALGRVKLIKILHIAHKIGAFQLARYSVQLLQLQTVTLLRLAALLDLNRIASNSTCCSEPMRNPVLVLRILLIRRITLLLRQICHTSHAASISFDTTRGDWTRSGPPEKWRSEHFCSGGPGDGGGPLCALTMRSQRGARRYLEALLEVFETTLQIGDRALFQHTAACPSRCGFCS